MDFKSRPLEFVKFTNMIIPCNLALKDCLPCNDDPIRNITAEAPDVDVFIGFRDFNWNPPLGVTYFQLACKAICFSEVSQEEANLCALRNAQECDWKGGQPPVTPPVPPGPDSPGGKGSGPNLPPANPRNSIQRFRNKVQTCDVLCADGSTFTETVAAGTITELSQALADEKAKSLACKMAQRNLFCISAAAPPSACVGESYFFLLSTSNGEDLIWSIDGDLPPGLSFDFFDATITGTPTVSGSFTFIVEVSDSLGRFQVKDFTICIMEIVTEATLPEATIDMAYATPLVQQPADVSSEVWTLVSGSLPDGIILASNGALNGTPTEDGPFDFTLKVDATCDGMAVSCQKTFSLDVSSVDCQGHPNAVQDLAWVETAATFNMVGGDGNFNTAGNGSGPIFVETTCDFLCNPRLDAYDLTIQFDWTVAGNNAFIGTQASFFMNGVDYTGTLFATNGAHSQTHIVSLPSGVNNTLRLYVVYSGIIIGPPGTTSINGTVTIRPLTPPPPP